MPFGIDTFRTRLDIPPALRAGGTFLTWNGNARPLFAGRNFLLGEEGFIWGHSEATSASIDEQDGQFVAGHVGPEHPELLTLLVDRVAPIQAPHETRQGLTGARGMLEGAIDANAICKRVAAAIMAGELGGSPSSRVTYIWLAVHPTAPFSSEYWAGWADTVNNAVLQILPGETLGQSQPFRPAIMCGYVAGAGGRLRPDPRVTNVLADHRRGMDTTARAFWADLQLFANAPADLVAHPSPQLDFNRFDPPTAPILWRFANGFTLPNGTAAGVPISVDALSPTTDPLPFMLTTRKWQPNVPTVLNYGFSNSDSITTPINRIPGIQAHRIPEMPDNGGPARAGHFTLPGGDVTVVGRYIRANRGDSLQFNETQRVSNAHFDLFTIWEGPRTIPGLGRAVPHALDPNDADHPENNINNWGDFTANSHKYIFYYQPDPDGDPTTLDAGGLDGRDAFRYCWEELRQPSQTPVFFAIDFDPFDVPNPHAVPFPPTPPPAPQQPNPTRGWPANPVVATRKTWITRYFELIRDARNAYYAQTGHYYLIGVYAAGATLQFLYEHGVVSHFWQATSFGHNGSRPPLWPWFHVNRWQFNLEANLESAGWVDAANRMWVPGADPEVDWGDGGTWNLVDTLAQAERAGRLTPQYITWGDLVEPLPFVPIPPPPPVPVP